MVERNTSMPRVSTKGFLTQLMTPENSPWFWWWWFYSFVFILIYLASDLVILVE